MRIVMAKSAVDVLRDAGLAQPQAGAGNVAQAAAEAMIKKLEQKAHSTGGLILLDREGNPAFAFNTPAMSYGYVQPDGSFQTFP